MRLPRQIQISFRIVVLGTVERGENVRNQPAWRASYGTWCENHDRSFCRASSPLAVPPQSPDQLTQKTISSNVNGLPFPLGVTGTVAQNKPNTQPEEKQ